LPTGLGELGVDRDILPRLARAAMQDLSHATNPRTAAEQDYFSLLSESL
jgi:alcohol dehydrogenase class IV